jgi:hypothetical protein
LFFWQAAQEAEDTRVHPERKPLVRAPSQGPDAMERIRLDTFVGMGFSNLVALAIIMATAATLHAAGVTDIQSSTEAAEALRPVAGPFAFTLFALGIIGTGLRRATCRLPPRHRPPIPPGQERRDRKPEKAKRFYMTIALATTVGVAINFSPPRTPARRILCDQRRRIVAYSVPN